MIRTLFFFTQLALLIGVTVWSINNPGTVTLEWQNYVMEAHIGVFIGLTLLSFLLLFLTARFFELIKATPGRVTHFWQKRRARKGYRALTKGMVAVAAGNAEEARKQAEQASHMVDEQPLILMLAAQAAQINGDAKGAEYYYQTMLDRPETKFLGLRGLMIHARRAGDLQQARDYSEQAFKMDRSSPWVIRAMFDLNLRIGDFEKAQIALKESVKNNLVDDAQYKRYQALLTFEQAMNNPIDDTKKETLFKKAHRLSPEVVVIAAHLGAHYKNTGKVQKAQSTLLEAWGIFQQPTLANIYLSTFDSSPQSQFDAAYNLYHKVPTSEESLILMATHALDAKKWEKAEEFLGKLFTVNGSPCVRACQLKARFYDEKEGNLSTARHWLKEAAQAVDSVWSCRNCDIIKGHWDAFCPNCETFDAFRWEKAARTTSTLDGIVDASGNTKKIEQK